MNVRAKKRKTTAMKVVEELCQMDTCPREGSAHWHPLTVGSLLDEDPGEYTLTVRVRVKRRAGRSRP